ncbi:MAG: hypothetical protein AAGK00_00175 [Pseudomonadota bacterium]
MTVSTDSQVALSTPASKPAGRAKGYLHGPVIDFMLLGGGSLPIFCLLMMLPSQEMLPYVAATVLFMSHFVNNPHFMHSYQIFYEGFPAKIAPGAPLRSRYLVAGLLVPAVMIAFFTYCVVTADARLMGLSVNAMLFTVGWHYVKQGYGILIVESVMKRAFLSQREKDWLRYNALAIWILSWSWANRAVGTSEFYGLQFATFAIPDPVFFAIVAISVITGLLAAGIMLRKALSGPVPVNGLFAYVASAYVWLVVSRIDPLMLAVVPVFHSLQYLAVVWRYRLNKEHAGEGAHDQTRLLGLFSLSTAQMRMVRFVWFGTILAAMWFWVVPLTLDAIFAYREDIFGQAMFVFIVVVFVNVHHYFLDNVMWRRENTDVKEHLFG